MSMLLLHSKIFFHSESKLLFEHSDLYNIYDKDKELKENLRKAPKLSYQALHPGNNKQNVLLALAIFHDTIAAGKSYYPNREEVSRFLNVIHTWWIICSSKLYTYSVIFHNTVK